MIRQPALPSPGLRPLPSHSSAVLTRQVSACERVQSTNTERHDSYDTVTKKSQGLTHKVATSVVACAGAALADPFMSLVDTAFVGRLGVLQLAALGPNGALFNVVFFLGFSALGVVATNQISAAHGASDRRAVGRSLILSSIVAFVLGLLITLVLITVPCSALQLFQTNAEMMPYAKTYCVIRALGVSSALLMVVFQAAFRALEDMRTPLLVVLASGLLNAVLDPILIYPLGLGIAGAAWATAASQVAGAAAFAAIIFRKRQAFGLPQAWTSARETAVSHAWSATANASSDTAPPEHAPDQSSGTIQKRSHPLSASGHPRVPEPGACVVYSGAAAPTPRLKSPVAHAAAPTPRLKSSVVHATAPGGARARAPAPIRIAEPGLWHTLWVLLQELPWSEFITTSLKLAMRCLLVLSTWTFASIAATTVGTYTMAAYQIMQQVLQLQLSVSWAFLAVGQSLVGVAIARSAGGTGPRRQGHPKPRTHTPSQGSGSKKAANIEANAHSQGNGCKIEASIEANVPSQGNGNKIEANALNQGDGSKIQWEQDGSKIQANGMGRLQSNWSEAQREARVVGSRVVGLAIAASVAMAVLTFILRGPVPKLFTTDPSVLKLVEGSVLMMCVFLAISWNNAIEGVLLGAGDTQFVINVYPACVCGFMLALACSVAAGWGLSGIWGALVLYYVGLSGTLSARFWVQRFRCKI